MSEPARVLDGPPTLETVAQAARIGPVIVQINDGESFIAMSAEEFDSLATARAEARRRLAADVVLALDHIAAQAAANGLTQEELESILAERA